jgi:hypothetical protein
MRLAEMWWLRCASRRPIMPARMSWQSYRLNGVECRRKGPRDVMELSPGKARPAYQIFSPLRSSPCGSLHDRQETRQSSGPLLFGPALKRRVFRVPLPFCQRNRADT